MDALYRHKLKKTHHSLSWSCLAVVFVWDLGLRWGWAGFPGSPEWSLVQLLQSHLFLICARQDAFLRISRSNHSLPDCSHCYSGNLGDFYASFQVKILRVLTLSSNVPSVCSSIARCDIQAKGFGSPLWIQRHLPAHPTIDSVPSTPQPASSPPLWKLTWIQVTRYPGSTHRFITAPPFK